MKKNNLFGRETNWYDYLIISAIASAVIQCVRLLSKDS
jgi:hypothetical protein